MKTIQVSDECWRALKRQATFQERTMAAVVEEAVTGYLKAPTGGSVAPEKTRGAAVRTGADVASNEPSKGVRSAVAEPGPTLRLEQEKTPPRSVRKRGESGNGSDAKKNEGAAVVCQCGHQATAHKDLTGTCQWGPGCGCRAFDARKEPVF